jgi:hypothetical protein
MIFFVHFDKATNKGMQVIELISNNFFACIKATILEDDSCFNNFDNQINSMGYP